MTKSLIFIQLAAIKWFQMEEFTTPQLDYVDYDNNPNLYGKSKFEVLGEEMIEKKVNSSGNSGRIYLPPEWIGMKVKVIKL